MHQIAWTLVNATALSLLHREFIFAVKPEGLFGHLDKTLQAWGADNQQRLVSRQQRHGHQQAGQPGQVITVKVGDEYCGQPPETDAGATHLKLSALAAVE
jgi:hypothetical protein